MKDLADMIAAFGKNMLFAVLIIVATGALSRIADALERIADATEAKLHLPAPRD